MKISMSEFAELKSPVAAVIHSLTPSLYQVVLSVDGRDRLLAYDDGRPYRAKNLQNAREMLASMPVAAITMRHESAYDEMVGQPASRESNALELNLKQLDRTEPTVH